MSVDSPCIRNCCLDKDDVCLGCNRMLDEITAWGDASDREKREILARAERRRTERRPPKFE